MNQDPLRERKAAAAATTAAGHRNATEIDIRALLEQAFGASAGSIDKAALTIRRNVEKVDAALEQSTGHELVGIDTWKITTASTGVARVNIP